jgi:hypothetical protein
MRLFEPWQGPLYRAEGLFGRRVLILGESHYGKAEEETARFTRDCVEYMAKAEKGYRFFTVVAKLLLNEPAGVKLSQERRRWFWDRVAFYNYVQRFPSTTSRVRPTASMWSQAAQCLPAVISELSPDFMLVLGCELRSRIPTIPPPTMVCAVQHPSSFGFRHAEWLPFVQTALRPVSLEPSGA